MNSFEQVNQENRFEIMERPVIVLKRERDQELAAILLKVNDENIGGVIMKYHSG